MNEPDYLRINRETWTRSNAAYTDKSAPDAWASPEVRWGVWHQREADIGSLPPIEGRDVIELGCGTAYVSAWMKRMGARRVVGVDVTPAQLATAARLNDEQGLGLELIEANAEDVPLPDAAFDVAVSEYGASIWCDPYKWIPEAARLLRSGGDLWFLRGSPLVALCSPDEGRIGTTLLRPQRGMMRLEWLSEPAVEFTLSHGDMMRLLMKSGFEVLDLIELYAPEDAVDHPYYSYVPADWAKQWPHEEIWRARKR